MRKVQIASPNPFQHPSAFSWDRYRFGFNGKEKDDEVKGDGNILDFGGRINDSRLGRRLSLDSLRAKYPSLNSYNGFANNPILSILMVKIKNLNQI